MRLEIELNIGSNRALSVRGGGLRFCRARFLRVVSELPEGTRTCYAVFSDTPDECSYRITQPRGRKEAVLRDGRFIIVSYPASGLTDIQGNWLYISTRKRLAWLYKLGFRYVHLEVDA